MQKSHDKSKDIDEYITSYPKEIQKVLEQLRATVKKAAPQADEVISYGMPAFKLNGMLVWFAAHSKHIGFYPRVSGIEAFKKELSIYKGAKGSVQFPLDNPLPLGLITKIVKFRVIENLQKARPYDPVGRQKRKRNNCNNEPQFC
ncbi:MAG: DUF1801 domain-containing protein [Bacteroidota bacterium]|nr:DUF1801 domain-containing protein [Bacteroidota bacterium]